VVQGLLVIVAAAIARHSAGKAAEITRQRWGVLGAGESHAPYAGCPNPSLATAKPARLSSLVANQKDGLGATLARYGL
jgi:hypothetical protein